MKLSIVATLYQSAEHVAAFHARAGAAARALVGEDYEIILVNDGSPDDSLALALALCEGDAHLTLVDLSRNFGHHPAMMTGLAHACGERVFLLDSDLEEEPEWLSTFAAQMAEQGCDVVFGVQGARKGGWFERWSGQLFYRLYRALTGVQLPNNLTTARLMSRRYVDALLRHQEREIVIAGLWLITGFEQRPCIVKKHSHSKSSYTLTRKMAHVVNSVTSFSNRPLVLIFNTGATIFLVACVYTSYLLLNWLLYFKPLSGWTSVMASIWMLGGLIISFIGVVGIYVSKIFTETKQRPYSIVRAVHGTRQAPTAARGEAQS
ncbi:MAG: glycosyltransferase family 2 protein [Janthinobacterium sp.]